MPLLFLWLNTHNPRIKQKSDANFIQWRHDNFRKYLREKKENQNIPSSASRIKLVLRNWAYNGNHPENKSVY